MTCVSALVANASVTVEQPFRNPLEFGVRVVAGAIAARRRRRGGPRALPAPRPTGGRGPAPRRGSPTRLPDAAPRRGGGQRPAPATVVGSQGPVERGRSRPRPV